MSCPMASSSLYMLSPTLIENEEPSGELHCYHFDHFQKKTKL